MSEHVRTVPLPEDHVATTKTPPEPRLPSSWDGRTDLVRKYLLNPALWPDGLDWPNWTEPHELWFTGFEDFWIPRAIARQKQLDEEAAREQQAPPPKRRSFFTGRNKSEALIKETAAHVEANKALQTMLGNARKILEAAKTRAEKAVAPATENATENATINPATEKIATEKDPATKKQRGRPSSGKALSSSERSRKRRAELLGNTAVKLPKTDPQ